MTLRQDVAILSGRAAEAIEADMFQICVLARSFAVIYAYCESLREYPDFLRYW